MTGVRSLTERQSRDERARLQDAGLDEAGIKATVSAKQLYSDRRRSDLARAYSCTLGSFKIHQTVSLIAAGRWMR